MDTDDESPGWGRPQWEAMLDELAEACLAEFPEQVTNAGKEMALRVRKDPRLQQAMLESLLVSACAERIRKILSLRNRILWHSHKPDYDPTQRSRRLKRTAERLKEANLMNYALMGGKQLSHATKADLVANAEFQIRQGDRMVQTGLWLQSLANMMNDTQIVRDRFDEADLRAHQDAVLRAKKESETISAQMKKPEGDQQPGSEA